MYEPTVPMNRATLVGQQEHSNHGCCTARGPVSDSTSVRGRRTRSRRAPRRFESCPVAVRLLRRGDPCDQLVRLAFEVGIPLLRKHGGNSLQRLEDVAGTAWIDVCCFICTNRGNDPCLRHYPTDRQTASLTTH